MDVITSPEQMEIAVFTTGGTIDKVYFDGKGGYKIGPTMARRILRRALVRNAEVTVSEGQPRNDGE